MSDTISYSKYPTDGQLTYNGGNFMTSNQASTMGCAGTSCKTLAANSVFTDPIEQGRTLAPATNTATNYNPSCGLSGGAKKRRSRRRRSSRKMKGGSTQPLLNPDVFMHRPTSGGSSKKRRSRRRRSSRKSMRRVKRGRRSTKKHVKKSHRVRHSRKHRRRTMKGGSKNQNQQLMSNICHSAGYSIGPLDTTIKPADVGLAAGHFAPYTKTQNN